MQENGYECVWAKTTPIRGKIATYPREMGTIGRGGVDRLDPARPHLWVLTGRVEYFVLPFFTSLDLSVFIPENVFESITWESARATAEYVLMQLASSGVQSPRR